MPDEASNPPPDPPARSRPLFTWPPPGLERIQGDLWKIVRELGVGGVLLVLPLLWEVTADTPFHAYGPLGGSGWVLLVLSGAGVLSLVVGFVDLFRLCRRSAHAMKNGFGAATVLTVAADHRRESGLVLQGARAFSTLGAVGRRRVLFARVSSAVFALFAAVWLPTGFALGVFFAGRGAFGPPGLLYLVLMPLVVASAGTLIVRGWEHSTTSRARKRWYAQPWTQDLVRAEISAWQEEAAERTSQVGLVSEPVPTYRVGFVVGAAVASVAGLAIVVCAIVLTFVSTVGPVLTSIAMPRFTGVQERALTGELLRRYVVEPDSSITPEEAGRTFHSLLFAGEGRPDGLFLTPEVAVGEPWFPGGSGEDNPTGLPSHLWSAELFPALAAGELSPDALDYLGRFDTHPARPLMARAAAAPAADLVGTRYRMPFPDGTSYWDLPIPRYSGLRRAIYAQVGHAAWLADQGRSDEAERILRQTVSVGLLMADDGVSLIENLVGLFIAELGAEGLIGLYRYSGRDTEADDLRWILDTAASATEVATVGRSDDPAVVLATLPDVVADPDAPRGLRWEYLSLLNTLAPCLNLHRMVFGTDEEYRAWLDTVQEGLVRYPAEREVFALLEAGVFGSTGEVRGAPAWVRYLVTLPLGGRTTAGSCASMIGTMSTF